MTSTGPVEFRNILCAVDLTPASAEVLRWAKAFADAHDAKLEIVHADDPDYPPYWLPSQSEDLAAESQKRRSERMRELTRLAGDLLGTPSRAKTAILDGHPAEALLRHFARTAADLVVIGSHGHSGFSRLRLGSVADFLIHNAVIPLLVARTRPDHRVPKIERLLCPVNFDVTGRRSLQVAAYVAHAFQASLVVVHAVREPSLDASATHRQLCQWVPPDIRTQCAVVETVRHGSPAEQILLAAREQSADLIVLGVEHRPFLEFAILGTTAERVVRHADRAVLVLPSKGEPRA